MKRLFGTYAYRLFRNRLSTSSAFLQTVLTHHAAVRTCHDVFGVEEGLFADRASEAVVVIPVCTDVVDGVGRGVEDGELAFITVGTVGEALI
jgi:hypothetical protein